MKIVRYTTGKKVEYGVWTDESVQSLAGNPYYRFKTTNRYHRLSDVRLLPPCTPSKIVGVGLNYRKHAEEAKMPLPTQPLIFLKPSTAVIGPEDNIIRPESLQQVPGVLKVDKHENSQITLKVTKGNEVLPHLYKWAEKNGVFMHDLEVISADLEDVFLELTGKKLRE